VLTILASTSLAEGANGFIEQELTYVLLLAIAGLIAILTRYVRLVRRVPYTVALVVVGLLVALFVEPVEVPISSDLILALLVPPLLFESTLHLKWRALKDDLVPVLLLALGGSLISSFLVALLLESSNVIELPLAAAIAFGALISATDPVAVVAFFRSLGVSKRLTVLVEGESLLNDGIAIVIFSLAVGAGTAINAGTYEGFNLGGAIIDFLVVAGGGLLVGIILGGFVSHVILRNVDDHLIETVTTVTLALGSFLVAEEFGLLIGRPELHLSGILAVVAAGLFVGNVGRLNTSPTTGIALDNFWELLAFIVNSFIFLFLGLAIDLTLFGQRLPVIILAVVIVLISRLIVVYGLVGAFNFIRPRRRISRPYRHVMYWGGLRGAISLALALTLSSGPFAEYAADLQLMTFGVVLFTLLVQGMTIENLIKRLGISGKPEHQLEQRRQQAMLYATAAGEEELDRLLRERFISRPVYDAMRAIYADEMNRRRAQFLEHLQDYPELEQAMVLQARADLLRAERDALGSARRRGLIDEELFDDLAREMDDRAAALELIRDVMDHKEQ
jgi:CPA1 family monovalent cation:H+ antiporter